MGTIHDYTDGTVLEDIAKALHVFRKNDGSLANTDIGQTNAGQHQKVRAGYHNDGPGYG